jgi:hypothetical protein
MMRRLDDCEPFPLIPEPEGGHVWAFTLLVINKHTIHTAILKNFINFVIIKSLIRIGSNF